MIVDNVPQLLYIFFSFLTSHTQCPTTLGRQLGLLALERFINISVLSQPIFLTEFPNQKPHQSACAPNSFLGLRKLVAAMSPRARCPALQEEPPYRQLHQLLALEGVDLRQVVSD